MTSRDNISLLSVLIILAVIMKHVVILSIYFAIFLKTEYAFSVDLFYAGEAVQFDQPQSFTCPYCGKLGLTENQLHEHVTGEHLSSSAEVVSHTHFN